jgi:hypothetical protein
LRFWLPVQDPLAAQEVALVELQVSVEELPCTIEFGFMLMVTVGAAAGVVTLKVALLLVVPPAPVQANV